MSASPDKVPAGNVDLSYNNYLLTSFRAVLLVKLDNISKIVQPGNTISDFRQTEL
jgi:hypothetical protein